MKQWSDNLQAKRTGEKTLTERLVKEQRLSKETAQLFATAKISYEDLRQVMFEAAIRFANEKKPYSYKYFCEKWPEIFPTMKPPHPTKQEVGETLGLWLADQAAVKLNFNPNTSASHDWEHHMLDLSWGQISSLGGNLVANSSIGRCLTETIVGFEFYGTGESSAEQKEVCDLLAIQGRDIRDRLHKHQHRALPASGTDGPRESPAEAALRRRVRELEAKAQDLETPIEHIEAYQRAIGQYHRAVLMQRQLQSKGSASSEVSASDIEKLKAKAEKELAEALDPRRSRQSRHGRGMRPVLDLPEPAATVEEGVSGRFHAVRFENGKAQRENAPMNHNEIIRGAASLANEISFFNHGKHFKPYLDAYRKNPGRADRLTVGKRSFLASRIITGHRVADLVQSSEHEFLNGKMPNERDLMYGIYCLSAATQPLLNGKPQIGYDVIPPRNVAHHLRQFEQPRIIPEPQNLKPPQVSAPHAAAPESVGNAPRFSMPPEPTRDGPLFSEERQGGKSGFKFTGYGKYKGPLLNADHERRMLAEAPEPHRVDRSEEAQRGAPESAFRRGLREWVDGPDAVRAKQQVTGEQVPSERRRLLGSHKGASSPGAENPEMDQYTPEQRRLLEQGIRPVRREPLSELPPIDPSTGRVVRYNIEHRLEEPDRGLVKGQKELRPAPERQPHDISRGAAHHFGKLTAAVMEAARAQLEGGTDKGAKR